jgi:hypothetical protein
MTQGVPSTTGVPPAGQSPTPGVTLGQGITPFDPYSTTPSTTVPGAGAGAPYAGASSVPPALPPTTPYPGAAGAYPAQPPPGAFPAQPPVMYPQTSPLYPPQPVTPYPPGSPAPPYMRLFEDTGFTYAWLPKLKENDLQIHDFDFFTTLTIPRFLWSPQPLKVTPGFQLHLWDGPRPPRILPTDPGLPGTAFTGYLDFGWEPLITPQFGGILHFRPYIGTDGKHVTSKNSIRPAGSGVAVLRFNEQMHVKAGAEYINRARYKILPAFGVLWMPDKYTHFDIYFPRPMLKKYFTTMGNSEVWWYVGGEYGGGTWTLELNPAGMVPTSLTDINDLRVFGGFEWINMRGIRDINTFIEVGFVWDREIIYAANQAFNYKPRDTLMLRAGFKM